MDYILHFTVKRLLLKHDTTTLLTLSTRRHYDEAQTPATSRCVQLRRESKVAALERRAARLAETCTRRGVALHFGAMIRR